MATESSPELLDQALSVEQAAQLRQFGELLFADAGREHLDRAATERRLAAARSAYDFFSIRSEPIAVRVLSAAGETQVVVVETATLDCPFIVDSLLEYFRSIGANVRSIEHPILRAARDSTGRLTSLEQSSAAESGESFVHAELELAPTSPQPDEIAKQVRAVLAEVRLATGDFERMTARALQICEETAAQRELVEVRDFLRWLVHGGFVFLGYRRYLVVGESGSTRFNADAESDLGIFRDHDESRFQSSGALADVLPLRRKLYFEGLPLVVSKVRADSHVHRRRPMDSITVRRTPVDDGAISFDQFIGLFTSKAYAEEAQHIPSLRGKLHAVLEAEAAKPGSHKFKELVTAFNSFPKDELFRASVPELRQQLRLILDVKTDSSVKLALLPDAHRGNVVALVVMPRELFSAEVRERIQATLARGLDGTLVYYYLALGEGYSARLHFCFAAEPPKAPRIRELSSEIVSLARRWEDRLKEHLEARFGAARARSLAARWHSAFSDDYKAAVPVPRAADDIAQVEALLAEGAVFHVELLPREGDDTASEIRMIGLGSAPMLSELMPTLQNFGIRVIAEDAHRLRPSVEGGVAHVQAFSVQGPDGRSLLAAPGAGAAAEAIRSVRNRIAEDDPLNALVLTAGLQWREVSLLRAYLGAAFQMRLAPARPALRRVLLNQPELARMLLDLFVARLDPDHPTPEQRTAELRASYIEKLSAIDNIADDRIARSLLSMVEATVRTNFFCPMPAPDPYIVLKFESGRIVGLLDTPPIYEIHVNSPSMEGCHLRAGKVARGGIRFSDRPDDFRTEILGLMKTQTVKNAIIVPIGSKGGFIVKRPAAGATGPETGIDAYRTLMNAMLDVTDNIVDGKLAHPPGVKVLDTDGAYLVVAADKGTAAFSDAANAIAEQRGFWLGDAFASGGEHGFDHKKIGITARGAWESAKRHLREVGRDPDRGAPITMIGIGDMSGDVFGNGLLRSHNVKLLAAFDHRHIFIDPDPEPAKSFDERKRLFDQPGSQWSDYSVATISKGGGVWRRGQKLIELSPQARVALGCQADALDGESLIRAILRTPVDMLYNGGIGTYVRAADETDSAVGDHANDACRIVASELRAKIVVEGGNLGFTQKARIEYALAGGRINTDAIDNSAGVDTSDHEVNLKILLQPEVARGKITFTHRNRVLADATEAVARSVLADNRDQALALSLEQIRSRTQVADFRDHLQAIEERGLLQRQEEALPSRETLRARRARFPGLTRPELALVTAYTKLDLSRRLEDTGLLDDSYLTGRFLSPYFPPSIAEQFAVAIPSHQLRRELIATMIANEVVDSMGSTFLFALEREYLAELDRAVSSWLIASDVLGIRARVEWLKSEERGFSAVAETEAMLALEHACRAGTVWALRNHTGDSTIGATIASFRPAFEQLSASFEAGLAGGDRERFEQTYRRLRETIGEGDVAHDLARLVFTGDLLTTLSLSFERAVDPARTAEAWFAVSAQFDFGRLHDALTANESEDRWERAAMRELDTELNDAHSGLCCQLLDSGADIAPRDALANLHNARVQSFTAVDQLMRELRSVPAPSLAALQVTVRALTRLARGS